MVSRYFFSLGMLLLTLECYYGQNWQTWGKWAPCTATCGTGTTSRVRICAGPDACAGHTTESGNCHNANPCMWGEWGSYGSCSVSCGDGVLTRFRDCDNGNITTNECVGSHNVTMPCTVQACPFWNNWSNWTACPVTCGSTGLISRFRTCNGTGECIGNSTETGPCIPVPGDCPGVWTQWLDLPCSKTCGDGTRIRTRNCLPPGGCGDFNQDAIVCNEGDCDGPVVFNEWNQWEQWGACSRTCGRRGRRTRIRTCGGSGCDGESLDQSRCERQPRCRKGRPGKRRRGGRGRGRN